MREFYMFIAGGRGLCQPYEVMPNNGLRPCGLCGDDRWKYADGCPVKDYSEAW